MKRIGVIGVGYLGQHHARIFSGLDGAQLSFVVDADIERAREIAGKYGCAYCADYRDIIDRVDALSIVTPTTLHYGIARDCIDAGKDILIEKPITCTVDEAEDIIRTAADRGVIVQVGHLERFNPAVVALHPLIGEPVFIEAERLSPFLGRGTDVDITLDLMIHDIDIVLALLSRAARNVTVADIKATGSPVLTETIDIARTWLEFGDGVQALVTASRLSPEKSRKLKVFQRDSLLLLDYQAMEIRRFFKRGGEIVEESVGVEKREPLMEELRDFVECITTRRRPDVSAVEGRNALQIALEIGRRIRGGYSFCPAVGD